VTTCPNGAISQWVGVGGYNSTMPLIQAGLYEQRGGYNGVFYEVVFGSWQSPGNHGVSVPGTKWQPGDRYYMSMMYHSASRWDWEVIDLDHSSYGKSGSITPPTGSTGGGTYYIQPSADFVSERPTMLTGGYFDYMNHSGTRFRTATAHINGGSDAGLVTQPWKQLEMFNGNTFLGYGDGLDSSSNFSEYWGGACH
jgi:hypothetical protein